MHAVLVDQSSCLTLWAKNRAACVRWMELPMLSSCCCLVDVPLIPNTGRQKLHARLGPWSLTLLCTRSLAACCVPAGAAHELLVLCACWLLFFLLAVARTPKRAKAPCTSAMGLPPRASNTSPKSCAKNKQRENKNSSRKTRSQRQRIESIQKPGGH